MKKQLFLSMMLLVASMEVFARMGGAGAGGSAPTPSRQTPSAPSRQVPSAAPAAPAAGAQGTSAAAQTVANHWGGLPDLVAGAASAVGQTIEGYTIPAASDVGAYDSYYAGKQYVIDGQVH